MMVAAFLACALSVTPMSFPRNFTKGKIHAHAALRSSADFLLYVTKDKEQNLLIVGGDPILLDLFRKAGLQYVFGAYGKPQYGTNKAHAVYEPGFLPFHSASMICTFWLEEDLPDGTYHAIKDAVHTIMTGGYFVFRKRAYTEWMRLLRSWGWDLLPFSFGPYVIWQKPVTIESLVHKISTVKGLNIGYQKPRLIMGGYAKRQLRLLVAA